MVSCEIELAEQEVTACSQGSPFLPSAITEETTGLEMLDGNRSSSHFSNPVFVSMDNSLSPSHTIVQIECRDHKGLIYDIMRTLKDLNIQVNSMAFEGFFIDQNAISHFLDATNIQQRQALLFLWIFSRLLRSLMDGSG